DRDIEIALHGVVARGLRLGFERQQPAGGGEGWFGLGIVFFGVVLAFGADALAHRNGDLVFIGGRNPDGAVIVVNAQAGDRGRQALLEMIVIVVGFAEN